MRPELDTKNPPGQQTHTPPEHQQLSDYIRSINRREALDNVASEKKLSFDEWWAKPWTVPHKQCDYGTAKLIWEAAQRNVK